MPESKSVTSSIKLLKGKKGVVLGYRRSRRVQHPQQVLLKFDGIDDESSATKLLGKQISWSSLSGKLFKGKVIGIHGKKGVVRGKFRRNLPGQSFRTEVVVV